MTARTDAPLYRADIYSAAAIRDTHPHYAALRALGPVVWLSKQKVHALPRYAECKAVLLDDETFISGGGVALNPLANRVGRGTTGSLPRPCARWRPPWRSRPPRSSRPL
jgi:hypothetical protein